MLPSSQATFASTTAMPAVYITEAIINGDEGAATCECLLSYISNVDELSEDARDYLGLDSEVDSKVNSAIADKKCIANNNLRSSITQLKID